VSTVASRHREYVQDVERRLETAVAAHRGTVPEAAARTLRSGGKRLRPLLVSLCAPESAAGRSELAAAGCSVELIHMATLVHDDVLDAAALRRGRPTVWQIHGHAIAVSTGDYLFARAFAELSATGDLAAVSVLADACLALARGEVLQRAQAGDPATPVERYLERCRLKTGRLFAAAATLGAHFGGLPPAGGERLARFAESLGLAFQIADDVLDCDGDPETTGKPLGTDLLDGTVSLPLILAAQRDAAVRAVIARGARPPDVLPTLARVVASGAVADARLEAARFAEEARRELEQVDGAVDHDALLDAVRVATERRS
jgi:geranylgeranyl pyrophosphate synthase